MPEKGSRHRPWFPFFASDFASTVRRWDAEEIGCYMLLLIEQWINEDVPQDERELARIHPDIPKHWKTKLQRKFPGGKNVRLEEIRDDMMERSAKNRDAALRRWGRDPDSEHSDMNDANGDATAHANADANAYPNGDANDHAQTMRKPMLSTPTSTSINKPKSKTKNKPSPVSDVMWKKFCDLYPKRNGPDPNKSARAKAERCLKTGAQWSDIMAGLRRYKTHCDTNVDDKQFVMRKESFLNPQKEFWQAEYAQAENKSDVGVDTPWNPRDPNPSTQTKEQELMSIADLLGVKRNPGESDDHYTDRLDKTNRARIKRLGL